MTKIKFDDETIMAAEKRSAAVVKQIADRFVQWRLPETVCADLCATDNTYKFPRSGTNLLNVAEAEIMAREVVLPAIAAEHERLVAEAVKAARAAWDAEEVDRIIAVIRLARVQAFKDALDDLGRERFEAVKNNCRQESLGVMWSIKAIQALIAAEKEVGK